MIGGGGVYYRVTSMLEGPALLVWFPLSPRCPWLRLNTWQPSCQAILVTLFLPALLSWSPTHVLYTHSLKKVFALWSLFFFFLSWPIYWEKQTKTNSMFFFPAPNEQALCRGLSLRESLALNSPSGNTAVCLPGSWRALPLGASDWPTILGIPGHLGKRS